MIYIDKKETPKKVQEKIIQIKKTNGWEQLPDTDIKSIRAYFDTLDKASIRESLIKEQHGLCAYCMKRIHNDNTMVIEHFNPIRSKADALNYQNMLGCCDGGRNENIKDKVLCCDASKGDKEITISPRDREFVDKIRYTKDGYIHTFPIDMVAERQINEVLHLNGILDEKGVLKRDTATQLVAGRRSAYRNYVRCMKKLIKRKGIGTDLSSEIRKMISRIEQAEEYPELAGVSLYFLKRRLKNSIAG